MACLSEWVSKKDELACVAGLAEVIQGVLSAGKGVLRYSVPKWLSFS